MEINIKNCKICWTEFFPNTNTQETCKNKDCKSKFSTNKKRIRNVELLKLQTKKDQAKRKIEWQKTDIIKRSILSDMKDGVGYSYCEECLKKSTSLELHHIAKRSEVPNHPKKHSKINSLILCRSCHELYHSDNKIRSKWIIQRELWNIFDIFKKDNFIK